jgi:hypothetical protein
VLCRVGLAILAVALARFCLESLSGFRLFPASTEEECSTTLHVNGHHGLR